MTTNSELIDELAWIIREVDEENRLTASQLAEAILSHPGWLWQPPAALGFLALAAELEGTSMSTSVSASSVPPGGPPIAQPAGEVPSAAEIDAAWLATWNPETGCYDVQAFAHTILARWGPGLSYQCDPGGDMAPHHRDSASEATASSLLRQISALVLRHRLDHDDGRRSPRVELPGDRSAADPPLPWGENPPPNMHDPLVVVVSQQTAVRALVRHYGWVHDGPDTLIRPCYPVGPSAASSETALCEGAVEDLVEVPGSIADHAAAASAAVA